MNNKVLQAGIEAVKRELRFWKLCLPYFVFLFIIVGIVGVVWLIHWLGDILNRMH